MDDNEWAVFEDMVESLIDALRFTHDDKHVKLFKFIRKNLFDYYLYSNEIGDTISDEWEKLTFKFDRYAYDSHEFAKQHIEEPTQCESFEVYMNDANRKNRMLNKLKKNS